jgi:hypothetical protein
MSSTPSKRPMNRPGGSSPFGSRQSVFQFSTEGVTESLMGTRGGANGAAQGSPAVGATTSRHTRSHSHNNPAPAHGVLTNWTSLIPPMPSFPPQAVHHLPPNGNAHPNQRHSIAVSPNRPVGEELSSPPARVPEARQPSHQYYQQQLQGLQQHQHQRVRNSPSHTPLPLVIPPQPQSQPLQPQPQPQPPQPQPQPPQPQPSRPALSSDLQSTDVVPQSTAKPGRKRRKQCKKCGLEITGQFVRALSNTFHVDCFTCNECGQPCSSKFFPHKEVDVETGHEYLVALCEYDYFKKLDLICFNCNSALRGPYITALGNKYHLEHFKCAVCQKVFESDESYYEHESNIYCHYHYSKLYALHCEGCHSSIVKQFVELFRGGRNQQWHPECYMVHKFWNVCITADSVGLQSKLNITQLQTLNLQNLKQLDDISSELLLAAEQQIENTVMASWLTLSGYEEVTAACISDMLLHACTCNQRNGLLLTGRLILNVEVLFGSLDIVRQVCARINAVQHANGSGVTVGALASLGEEVAEYFQALKKEPRNISGKIMSYLAILRKLKQISTLGTLSAELLSVITGCAHYLKLLIRYGLNNSLKSNKYQGLTEATDLFLGSVAQFETLAHQGVDELEHRLAIPANATDACYSCQKSIEKECVRYANRRWHPRCFVCSHCTQTISTKENNLRQCGYNSLGGLISCEECIAKDADAQTGYELISDLSQLIYLLKIALARSKSVMGVQQKVPTNANMSTIDEDQRSIVATEQDYSKTIDDVTRLRSQRQSQKLSNSIKQNARKLVIVEAPEADSARSEDAGDGTRIRNTSVSSQLSFTQNKESEQFSVSKKPLQIRDEPQRQLTNSHLDRTSDLLKNEKSLTLDDIPRIVAAEQAREQRPNAFKHHNSLYQGQKPMQPVKTVAAASGRSNTTGSKSSAGGRDIGYNRSPNMAKTGPTSGHETPPQVGLEFKRSKYFSELSKSEHFILRNIAIEALTQILNNRYNKEEMLGLIQTRKLPTFWEKLKFGGSGSGGSGKNASGVFGVDLQDLTKRYGVDSDHGVGPSKLRIPIVVDDIIIALRQKDMSVEGIFRLNGNIKKLRELTEAINKNPLKSPEFSTQTAVQLAALMKKWLRELPNPLLTFNLYELWISSQREQNPLVQKRIIHLAYAMLPRSHRDLLEVLLYFFSWVASFAEIDEETGLKMDVHNLATVIAPNILYSRQLSQQAGQLMADGLQPNSGGDSYFLAIEVVNQLIEMHEELSMIPGDLLEFYEREGFSKLPDGVSTKEIMSRIEKIAAVSPPFFVLSLKSAQANANAEASNGPDYSSTNTVSRGHSKLVLESYGETAG